MTAFPLLALSFVMKLAGVVFLICAVALILIILIQKGRGGGLSAAFGGGMASGILGSKTGDFLTWATIALVGVFLTIAVVMAKFYKPTVSDFGTDHARQLPVQQQGSESPPPVGGDIDTTTANKAADVNLPGE
jgi:preprotein translocase subunit SecG